MDAIQTTSPMRKPKQQVLDTFVCNGCGKHVQKKELQIPVGPRKGEWITANNGCKCEDIKLAAQAEERRRQAKNAKDVLGVFDSYSLLNKDLRDATFQTYEPPTEKLKSVKQTMEEYAESFGSKSSNLLLVGSYGTGKSHLSVSVTKELMPKGYKCLFISVPKLFTKIKQSYDKDSEFSESHILELIQKVDLLVLDDIGTEHTNSRDGQNSWGHTKLFEVLDDRSGKPTIFTTNLSSDQLEKKMNERNMSRMMDGTKVIKVDGPDYRRRGF